MENKFLITDYTGSVTNFISESIYYFQSHNVKNEDIKILMPKYFTRSLQVFLGTYIGNIDRHPFELHHFIMRFYGLQVSENYQNSIVVFFSDWELYPAILPQVLNIEELNHNTVTGNHTEEKK